MRFGASSAKPTVESSEYSNRCFNFLDPLYSCAVLAEPGTEETSGCVGMVVVVANRVQLELKLLVVVVMAVVVVVVVVMMMMMFQC